MKHFFIDILAFTTLLSSVLVITSSNPVHAIIFLISVFVNAAGYLMMLGVGFIGITYIIVYVGAITILFIFVIMMINIKLTDITEAGTQYTKTLPLALAIGSLFVYEIFTILPITFNNINFISILLNIITNLNGLFINSDLSSLNTVYLSYSPVIADTALIHFTQIESIGISLYTSAAVLLIISSVILLLAMIAPIFILTNNKQL